MNFPFIQVVSIFDMQYGSNCPCLAANNLCTGVCELDREGSKCTGVVCEGVVEAVGKVDIRLLILGYSIGEVL